MRINNFVDLAEIYRNADQHRANQQQASLRDLQIGETQDTVATRNALRDLYKQNTQTDPETGQVRIDSPAMIRGAAAMGRGDLVPKLSQEADASRTSSMSAEEKALELIGTHLGGADSPERWNVGKQNLLRAGLPKEVVDKIPDFSPAEAQRVQQASMKPKEWLHLQNESARAQAYANRAPRTSAAAAKLAAGQEYLNRLRSRLADGDPTVTQEHIDSEERRIVGTLQKEDSFADQDRARKLYAVLYPIGSLDKKVPSFDDFYSQQYPAIKAHGNEAAGAPAPAATPGAPGLPKPTVGANAGDVMQRARQAIRDGKDPAAVKERLRQLGFDPSAL